MDFDNPEERLLKAELSRQINNLIIDKKVKNEIAKEFGITQQELSLLNKGIVSDFSIEELETILNKLKKGNL